MLNEKPISLIFRGALNRRDTDLYRGLRRVGLDRLHSQLSKNLSSATCE